MVLAQALDCLGLDPADPAAHTLYSTLAEPLGAAPVFEDWRAVAAALACGIAPMAGPPLAVPWVLGIAGGQGAGKSTLAAQLRRALEGAGRRALAVSLDDFYLSRARRRRLAELVHPLLATRGVPGTHDVALLAQVVRQLGRPGEVLVPVFDKAADDTLPPDRWQRIKAPVDVLILEGWCVGARPQNDADLAAPVNDLEANEDPSGTWRRYVNRALAGPYAALWKRLDWLVYLEVPDMAAVLRWRRAQEDELPADRQMTPAALQRFIAHYERTTRAMQADLPPRAQLLVRLDVAHRVAEIRRGGSIAPAS